MNTAPDRKTGTAAKAERELTRLQAQIKLARAELARVQRAVAATTSHPDPAQEAGHELRHAQQQEANEHLIRAALGAQQSQATAEDAQRRQTEFLAVMAHELRNPLAPISNAAALLGMLPAEELLPRLQTVIERQVAHISRLVEDLLDVSRASTGKLRLERRRIDLADIIDEAVDGGRPARKTRGQQLELHKPAGALEVYGDPIRLTQVLSNLLDNASKYTPVGGKIGLSVVKVADDTIAMTVSDNGIGITAEALAEVFEPFVQASNAIGFNGVGLGIGLTVVRELVEAHGGTVSVTSAGSGLGSQFVVTLPLDKASAQADIPVAERLRPARASGTRPSAGYPRTTASVARS